MKKEQATPSLVGFILIENNNNPKDMANTDNENRRLKIVRNPQEYQVYDFKNWPVVDKNNEEIGRVKNLLIDEKRKKLCYLDVDIENSVDDQKIAAIPVGLFSLDKLDERVIIEDIDRDIIQGSPSHEADQLISYKDEMRIRAYFEKAGVVDVKSGSTSGAENTKIVEKEGEAINRNISDSEDSFKRDKELNEGRIADEMQGRYTPNLQGETEGIKQAATNAEGKHDIKASSGNPENPPAGDINPDTVQKPDGTEAITTDKPGETLGRSEIENRYRDPENQQLPGAMKNPEPPVNANNDFYRHEMFDDRRIRG